MFHSTLSEPAMLFCLGSTLLAPLTWAGLALINTGLGRSRSAAHSMMVSLCVVAVALLMYFFCGYSWVGSAGQPAHSLVIAGKSWSWMGKGPFFFRGISFDGSSVSLMILLQLIAVGLAALVPVGSASGRWRLGASCASTALLAGLTYPIYAHWTWGGGWLAQLGASYGLGHGFIDVGGSSSIHIVGGLTALSLAWILGPRRAKVNLAGMPTALPGHNSVYVIFGCFLALLGWLGLNSAGTVLFANMDLGQCVLVAVNTIFAAVAGGAAAALTTYIRFRRPDASLTANGWCGGLVASSAACPFIRPAEALVIGFAVGAVVVLAAETLEFRLKVDDPGGAISVHLLGGTCGVLSLGLFAQFPDQQPGQFLAQFVGLATLVGFIFPLTYGLNWLLDRFYPQRVDREGEVQGIDLHELGSDAYPEFVTHTEEVFQR